MGFLPEGVTECWWVAPFRRWVAVAHYQGKNFDREMQAAAEIRTEVGTLPARAAGLVFLPEGVAECWWVALLHRRVVAAQYQGRSFGREMQAAAEIRVEVETLAARAAGLVNAIVWPEQCRADQPVLSAGPQRAMSGLAELVEFEVECRYFDAVFVAE